MPKVLNLRKHHSQGRANTGSGPESDASLVCTLGASLATLVLAMPTSYEVPHPSLTNATYFGALFEPRAAQKFS